MKKGIVILILLFISNIFASDIDKIPGYRADKLKNNPAKVILGNY